MPEAIEETTAKIPLQDSGFTIDDLEDIGWLEETFGVMWESHVLESVSYDRLWGEFVTRNTLIGQGPDQEEFKLLLLNRPGNFHESRQEVTLTIDGELQDDIELIKTLLKYDTSALTPQEWSEILEYGDILDWS